jgi:cyclopropane fatty-acyl-phospholipid synthase-like methyltransferase
MSEPRVDLFDRAYGQSEAYYGTEIDARFAARLEVMELAGSRALDLGCGDGRHALYLARRGCRVTALDLSPVGVGKLMRRARGEGLPIAAAVTDVRTCRFPAGSWDLILAVTVLGHLPRAGLESFVGMLLGALRPGGVIMVKSFTTADPGLSATAGGVRHYFRPGELLGLLRGFELLEYWEGRELDRSHGAPHWHGVAALIGRRPGGCGGAEEEERRGA